MCSNLHRHMEAKKINLERRNIKEKQKKYKVKRGGGEITPEKRLTNKDGEIKKRKNRNGEKKEK